MKKNFLSTNFLDWRTSLLLMFAVFWLGSQNLLAQAGSASATYTAGDIETQHPAPSNTTTPSACAEELVVTIPVGKIITGVDVSYTMTTGVNPVFSSWEGYRSEQRSRIECINPGGISESSLFSGSGTEGTHTYNRTGLAIAENVMGGGDITFQMHAFRTWSGTGTGCDGLINKVDNNSWTVTVYYDDPPSCPVPANVVVSDITSSGAQIDWDSVSEASDGYEWFIVPEGEPVFSSIESGSGPSSVTTDGLTPNTSYDVYVRASCGPFGVSDFSSPINFTTLCEASSIPWSENFDGLAT